MAKNIWIAVLLLLLISTSGVSAQSDNFAATATIIGGTVYFTRENTTQEFSLASGAVVPFGIGDSIRTGDNGRTLITITPDATIFLLPDSIYTILEYTQTATNTLSFTGELEGIVIHYFDGNSSLEYVLQTETYQASSTNGHFTTWAVENRLNALVVADGEAMIIVDDESYSVEPSEGFAVPYSTETLSLSAPLHASQLVARAIDCQGIVSTSGSEGLRLRGGAALDYVVVDVLQDGQEVSIVGTTENSLWYRIPFQTGFGWIYSSLIESDCDNLERFPDLVGEAPEQIKGVTDMEIVYLEPFYGTYLSNSTFYR